MEYEDKGPGHKYETIDNLANYNAYKKYGANQLIYVIDKLIEAGFLEGQVQWDDYQGVATTCSIVAITYSGHELLDTIRDNKVWRKTKEALADFSSTAVSTVGTVAKSYVLAKIAEKTGLKLY